MAQELFNFLTVDPKQANWNATINTNNDSIADFIKTIEMVIDTQGDTGTPSDLQLQLQTGEGVDVNEQFQLRVRVSDSAAWANATNATIAAAGSTTLLETFSAGKDLLLQSDANGLVEITMTNATAETVTLRIGPSYLSPQLGKYQNTLDIIHA